MLIIYDRVIFFIIIIYLSFINTNIELKIENWVGVWLLSD